MNSNIKYILQFIVLVFLQVAVLNNIEIGNYLVPYIYILFILLLPIDLPGWLMLIIAFILGLAIDLFSHTLGFHVMATVLMAYIRNFILVIISPRDGYEGNSLPRISTFGFAWFLKYAVVLVLVHHLTLFTIELFRFDDLPHILLRTLLSGLFSLTFIVSSQYLIFKH